MPTRYVRTPAGQAEIQARARNLGRPVRNLLLVINDSRTIDEWVVGVNGVTADDVAMLISEGLIGVAGGVAPPAAAGPAFASKPAKPAAQREAAVSKPAAPAAAAPATDGDWGRTQQVIRHAGYSALYDALNSVGKAKLGLVRGYRFALEVEKCSGVEEIRTLALKFAEQLRAEHGMAAVGEFTYAIGAVKA
jgi:hypothetical protein